MLLLYYTSFLTYLVYPASTILGTNGLNSADVPLSNKQTNKQSNKQTNKQTNKSLYPLIVNSVMVKIVSADCEFCFDEKRKLKVYLPALGAD